MNDQTIELRRVDSGARTALAICFFLWGGIGFFVALASVMGTWLGLSRGLGRPANITMGIELWIGGLILFGLGALLAGATYVTPPRSIVPVSMPPHQIQKDGSVIAQMPDGSERRFANWKDFWAATH